MQFSPKKVLNKLSGLYLSITAWFSLERRYYYCEGYIDQIENGKLLGWAYNRSKPNKILKVDIYQRDKFLAHIKADIFRDDLLDAGKGNGSHGFSYSFSPQLIPEGKNELHVCYAGTSFDIMRPVELLYKRKKLSKLYLKGDGIEIGALHNPLWVPAVARVKYVDHMDLDSLLKNYPELRMFRLTRPDIIDDGEQLCTIADESLDFIIMNHMLEHCENPIGTIRQHMKKLKKGGILYCTVPDMRFFVDAPRTLTTFEHLVLDDRDGSVISREHHYHEWVDHWEKHILPESKENRVRELMEQSYSIQFHVRNEETFRDFLARCQLYLDNCFTISAIEFNHTEIIAILKKK